VKALSRGIGLGLGILGLVAAASAQESLDKGKTPEQLYTANCALCHKSPRGLARAGGILGVENFLRDHYTTSKEAAAAIAGYLKSVDQSAPPPRQRAAKPAAADSEKSSGKDKPADKKSVKRGEPKPADAKPAGVKPDESKADKKADKKAEKKDAGKRKKPGGAKLPATKPAEGMETKPRDADKPQPKSDEPKPSEAKPSETKQPEPKASESKPDAPAKDSK
jgi:hypothetical protein